MDTPFKPSYVNPSVWARISDFDKLPISRSENPFQSVDFG